MVSPFSCLFPSLWLLRIELRREQGLGKQIPVQQSEVSDSGSGGSSPMDMQEKCYSRTAGIGGCWWVEGVPKSQL